MPKANHTRTTSKSRPQRRKATNAADKNASTLTVNDLDPGDYLWDFNYEIKTIAGLVEALGGEQELADKLNTTREAVHAWIIQGNLPPGWQLMLLGMVWDLGKTVAPGVFGFSKDCRFHSARGLAKFMIPKRLAEIIAFRGGADD